MDAGTDDFLRDGGIGIGELGEGEGGLHDKMPAYMSGYPQSSLWLS
jgi:hypothetical protein